MSVSTPRKLQEEVTACPTCPDNVTRAVRTLRLYTHVVAASAPPLDGATLKDLTAALRTLRGLLVAVGGVVHTPLVPVTSLLPMHVPPVSCTACGIAADSMGESVRLAVAGLQLSVSVLTFAPALLTVHADDVGAAVSDLAAMLPRPEADNEMPSDLVDVVDGLMDAVNPTNPADDGAAKDVTVDDDAERNVTTEEPEGVDEPEGVKSSEGVEGEPEGVDEKPEDSTTEGVDAVAPDDLQAAIAYYATHRCCRPPRAPSTNMAGVCTTLLAWANGVDTWTTKVAAEAPPSAAGRAFDGSESQMLTNPHALMEPFHDGVPTVPTETWLVGVPAPCTPQYVGKLLRRAAWVFRRVAATLHETPPWLDHVLRSGATAPEVVDGILVAFIATDQPRECLCLDPTECESLGHGSNGDPIFSLMNAAMCVSRDATVVNAEPQDAASAVLRDFYPYLVRLDTFLAMLPPVRAVFVRSVTARVGGSYALNSVVVWPSFTFVSSKLEQKEFDSSHGTFFIIRAQSSRQIAFASAFPEHAEAIMPSNGAFVVTSKMSPTILATLGLDADVVTLTEVGMTTTSEDVFESVRHTHFVFRAFHNRYVEPRVAPTPPPNRIEVTRGLYAAVDSSRHVVLVGAPGCGKTFAMLACVSRWLATPGHLPVFVDLPLVHGLLTVEGALDAHVAATLGTTDDLSRYHVVLLLDAFDEVDTTGSMWRDDILGHNPWCRDKPYRVVLSCRDDFLDENDIIPSRVLLSICEGFRSEVAFLQHTDAAVFVRHRGGEAMYDRFCKLPLRSWEVNHQPFVLHMIVEVLGRTPEGDDVALVSPYAVFEQYERGGTRLLRYKAFAEFLCARGLWQDAIAQLALISIDGWAFSKDSPGILSFYRDVSLSNWEDSAERHLPVLLDAVHHGDVYAASNALAMVCAVGHLLNTPQRSLRGCRIVDCNLRDAKLYGALLADARFERCDFHNSALDGADIHSAQFVHCENGFPMGPIISGHTDRVNSVCMTTNGKRVVSGSHDTTIRVWDIASGTTIAKLEGHTAPVLSVCVTLDGGRIVSGSSDKTVRVWDVLSGRQIAKFVGHNAYVTCVCCCAAVDGPQLLVVVSCSQDKTIRVWHGEDDKNNYKLECYAASLSSVCVTGDGRMILSASDDALVRIWSTSTRLVVFKLAGHTGPVTSVCVSEDGRRVVSASEDGTVRVWECGTGKEISTLTGHRGHVTGVCVTADGSKVVSASKDTTVRVWDVVTGKELSKFGGHSEVNCLCTTSDGSWVVAGCRDANMVIWSQKAARRRNEVASPEGHMEDVACVCATTDGKRVICVTDKAIRIFDTLSGREVTRLEGHAGAVTCVCVRSDCFRIVSGSQDCSVRIWDTLNSREVSKLEGHCGAVLAVCLTMDGSRIISGSVDTTVRVWSFESLDLVFKLEGHTSSVWSVCVREDGTRMVSSSDDTTVIVWDMASGQEVFKLQGHTSGVTSVCVTADGSRIISGSRDATLRLWDADTGTEVCKLDGAHHGVVRSVCLTADGQHIVSAGSDGNVVVWDAAIYGPEAPIHRPIRQRKNVHLCGQHGDMRSVCATADGSRIVSGCAEGRLYVWDMETTRLVCVIGLRNGFSASGCTGRPCKGEDGAMSPGMWHGLDGDTLCKYR